MNRVLVVDDDLAVRLRLRDLLEREPRMQVEEAVDGFAALEAIARELPDLVLLDLMMPGMTGLEVCATMRRQARTREIPVIVLSAAEESEAMIAAIEAGADDFLRKPFCAPELQAKVRNITRLNRFRALTQERDRFRWLLDRSLEPLVIADQTGNVAYANTRAREVFGFGEAPGEDVVSVISRHFRCEPPGAFAAWRELRWPNDQKFSIYQPETPHAASRWFEVELQQLEHGKETVLKFTNRSGWVRRELETFTFQHLIAHKVRTPLNGLTPILSYIDSMQTKSADEEMTSLLRFARESADRLQDTLCSVLRFHAAVFAAPTEVPTNGARAPIVDVLEHAAESAGVAGRCAFSGEPITVTNPELLEVVFTELLDNYGKFSGDVEATIHVSCGRSATGDWEICLTAPGPDLAPEIIAQLGRPYWQPERVFSGEVPGMGLGLATVRQLLRWRGGDLRFEKNLKIGGVESRVILPAALTV